MELRHTPAKFWLGVYAFNITLVTIAFFRFTRWHTACYLPPYTLCLLITFSSENYFRHNFWMYCVCVTLSLAPKSNSYIQYITKDADKTLTLSEEPDSFSLQTLYHRQHHLLLFLCQMFRWASSLVPLIQTLTALTSYATFTVSNHPLFLRVSNVRRNFHEAIFFFHQNGYIVRQTTAWMLPWRLQIWLIQVKSQSFSSLFPQYSLLTTLSFRSQTSFFISILTETTMSTSRTLYWVNYTISKLIFLQKTILEFYEG